MTKNINKKTEVTTFNNNNVKDSFITMFNNETEFESLFNSNIMSNYAVIIIEQIEQNITVNEQGIKLKNKSYLKDCLLTLASDNHLLASYDSKVKKHLNKSKIDRYTRFINNINFLTDLMKFSNDKEITLKLIASYFEKKNLTSQNAITNSINASGTFSDKKESKAPSGKVNQSESNSNKSNTLESIEESSKVKKDKIASALNDYLNWDNETKLFVELFAQSFRIDLQTNNKDFESTSKFLKSKNIKGIKLPKSA